MQFPKLLDERVDIRQRLARDERDDLRRSIETRREDQSRRFERDELESQRRNDLNRRGSCEIYPFFHQKFTKFSVN